MTEVNNWIAIAELDGWGEETMLLARLVAAQCGGAPVDYLPGWAWLKKEKRNG